MVFALDRFTRSGNFDFNSLQPEDCQFQQLGHAFLWNIQDEFTDCEISPYYEHLK